MLLFNNKIRVEDQGLRKALARNAAYIERIITEINDKEKIYISRAYQKKKLLTIITSSHIDKVFYIDYAVSDPDNLRGTFLKKDYGIKRSGAYNMMETVKKAKKLGFKFIRSDAASKILEANLKRMNFYPISAPGC